MFKIRKIYIDNLPKWDSGTYKGKICWKNCVGSYVKFEFDEIESQLKIIGYNKDTLHIEYKNNTYSISTYNFKHCQISKIIGKKTKDFKIDIGANLKTNTRNITITNRFNKRDKNNNTVRKYYNYKCNICGWDNGVVEESKLLKRKSVCSCCRGTVVVEGINDITTREPWMIEYFKNGNKDAKLYTPNSNKKIFAICPDCGRVSDKEITIANIYAQKNSFCSCSDGFSYPNKFIRNTMYELEKVYGSLEYEFEYEKEWTKKKRFDCWFKYNNKEYIVEMDGLQHKNGSFSCYGGNTIDDEIINDEYKTNIANSNNIDIIRIDCGYSDYNKFNYVVNSVLNSKLNYIFNLSLLDFNLIGKNSEKNIVKSVCYFWDSDENPSILDICSIYHISKHTVRRYLKTGDMYGWCKYDPLMESRNVLNLNIKKNSKTVINIETGILFDSTHDCERKSIEYFGFKISSSTIASVCRGDRTHTKGLHFKYV